MKTTATSARTRALLAAAALTAGTALGVGFGATAAQASTASQTATSQTTAIHDGNAPQCIHTSVGTDGDWWDTQTAYNACGQSYRVKLVWAVAQGDCQTLDPGGSMTYEVLKPAWAQGADLC